jgi:hypothetical protein
MRVITEDIMKSTRSGLFYCNCLQTIPDVPVTVLNQLRSLGYKIENQNDPSEITIKWENPRKSVVRE